MVLTAAEKQRRYRERLRANNPEKYEAFKRQNAARNRGRKKICQCTKDEKEIIRQQWRIRKRDALKKQWNNIRDAQASSGQCAKLNELHSIPWPRSKPTSFYRPHLELSEIDSNKQIDADDDGPTQSTNTTPTNTAQSQQNNAPNSRRISFDQTLPQEDKVINITCSNRDEDDTDLLLKSYAKKLKTMTKRRQATVKFEIAKLMLKAELEECDEMHLLNKGQDLEMVMIVEQPTSSAGLNTNDTTFIKSSPPRIFENDPI